MRLRDQPGPHRLGDNMHCLQGHPRLDFVLLWHKPGAVLDVGSGEGAFGLALHNEGNTVTLMDIFPVEPPAPGIEVVTLDADKMDYEQAFDTILFMELIEHLETPIHTLLRCIRALKPGGRILITTPYVDTWDDEPDHLWRFDMESLGKMLLLLPEVRRLDLQIDDTFVYAVVEKGNG